MRIFTAEHRRKISIAAVNRYAKMSLYERSRQTHKARAVAYTNEAIEKANKSRAILYAQYGGPNSGRKFSHETRIKMSEAQRNRWASLSDEERENWGKKFGGFKGMSDEGKNAIGESAKKRMAAKSKEEKEEMRRVFLERTCTPEVLGMKSDYARKRWAAMTVEQRREANRKSLLAANSVNKKKTKIEKIVEGFLCDIGIVHIYQKPLGPYFADFYIPEKNLVVECDGAYWHSSNSAKEKDSKRDAAMYEMGVKVLRLSESTIKKMTIDDFIKRVSCF